MPIHLNMAMCQIKAKDFHTAVYNCSEVCYEGVGRGAAQPINVINIAITFKLQQPLWYTSHTPHARVHKACAYARMQVLKLDPGNIKALFRRGMARHALGQTEAALEDLQAASVK